VGLTWVDRKPRRTLAELIADRSGNRGPDEQAPSTAAAQDGPASCRLVGPSESDDPVEPALARMREILAAADRFAAEMKRQGIHVGIGGAIVRCATCGKPWPCDGDDFIGGAV
jgi:hypothetical protein